MFCGRCLVNQAICYVRIFCWWVSLGGALSSYVHLWWLSLLMPTTQFFCFWLFIWIQAISPCSFWKWKIGNVSCFPGVFLAKIYQKLSVTTLHELEYVTRYYSKLKQTVYEEPSGDSGWVCRVFNGKKIAFILEQHIGFILEQSKGFSLSLSVGLKPGGEICGLWHLTHKAAWE